MVGSPGATVTNLRAYLDHCSRSLMAAEEQKGARRPDCLAHLG